MFFAIPTSQKDHQQCRLESLNTLILSLTQAPTPALTAWALGWLLRLTQAQVLGLRRPRGSRINYILQQGRESLSGFRELPIR